MVTLAPRESKPAVNQVTNRTRSSNRGGRWQASADHRQTADHKQTATGKCHRCGRQGHYARDLACTAWGKDCRKCGGRDHFAVECKSKPQQAGRPNFTNRANRHGVNCLQEDPEEDDSKLAKKTCKPSPSPKCHIDRLSEHSVLFCLCIPVWILPSGSECHI